MRTSRLVATVIIALLIVNSMAILVLFPGQTDDMDDHDGDHIPLPWTVATDYNEIIQDEVWTGRTATLQAPLAVKNSARLRMVNCNISVRLEDLVFWHRPALWVANGAELSLENSSISIVRSDELERAVVGGVWTDENLVPHLARIVNLENARNPVLHMDICWRGGPMDLSLGVLADPDGELEVIANIEREEPADEDVVQTEWRHLEFSLEAYTGGTPNLVLFAPEMPVGMVLLGNLRVLDGDADPPGDAFPTGHPLDDGWSGSGFLRLEHFMEGRSKGYLFNENWEETWNGLILGHGNVSLVNSRLSAPDGLLRRGSEPTTPEGTTHMPSQQTLGIIEDCSHGGHLATHTSTLYIRDSVLENVPVMAYETHLDVEGLHAMADSDIMTITRSSGSILDSTLESTVDRKASRGARYFWNMLLIDMKASPFKIHGCTFEGGELGLKVDDKDVEVEDCTFSHVGEMAYWDLTNVRDTANWLDLREANRFERCGRFEYLGTFPKWVEFQDSTGAGVEIDPGTFNLEHGLGLDWSPIASMFTHYEEGRATMSVPMVLVDDVGRVRTSEGTTVTFKVGRLMSEVDIWSASFNGIVNVDTLPLEPPWWEAIEAPVTLEAVEPNLTRGPGSYEFNISVSDERLYAVNNTLSLYLDGALVEEKGLYEDSQWLETYLVSHALNWTFEPGFHVLDVVVGGYARLDERNVSEVSEEFENATFAFLVLTGDPVDVEPWAPLEVDQVLLWPGINASIGPVATRDGAWEDLSIDLHGGNGSSLRIDCSGLQPQADLHISPGVGPSVAVVNASIHDLNIWDEDWWTPRSPESATLSISNVTCDVLALTPPRDAFLEDVHTSGTFYLSHVRSGDVTVRNCSFGGSGAYIYLHEGNVSVSDCTVEPDGPGGLTVVTSGVANTTITSVQFRSASLLVYRSAFYWTFPVNVTVTGCTFTGADCHLFVGTDLTQMDFYDADPWSVPAIEGTVEGNVFEGAGSTVTMHHGLFTRLWGDNDLEGGVRLYAYYLTRLMVIPPHGLPPKPGYYMVIDGQGYVQGLPFDLHRWYVPDGELCLDVTDDPAREANPPPVRVLLSSSPYFRDLVVTGFGALDPDDDNGETMYEAPPHWPDVLEEHVEGWPWGQESLKD